MRLALKFVLLLLLGLAPSAVRASGQASAATLQEGLDAFGRNDYATAFPILKIKAGQGDPTAQDVLAYMYENGWATPVDFSKAVYWYRKAAMQGAAPSETSLGRMYQAGWGVERNYSYAAWWYRKAAEHNYPGARERLNILLNAGVGISLPPEFANSGNGATTTPAETRKQEVAEASRQGKPVGSPNLDALIKRVQGGVK